MSENHSKKELSLETQRLASLASQQFSKDSNQCLGIFPGELYFNSWQNPKLQKTPSNTQDELILISSGLTSMECCSNHCWPRPCFLCNSPHKAIEVCARYFLFILELHVKVRNGKKNSNFFFFYSLIKIASVLFFFTQSVPQLSYKQCFYSHGNHFIRSVM